MVNFASDTWPLCVKAVFSSLVLLLLYVQTLYILGAKILTSFMMYLKVNLSCEGFVLNDWVITAQTAKAQFTAWTKKQFSTGVLSKIMTNVSSE